MRQSYALIDRANLKYNFLHIRKKVGKVKIMAVVKADAYGHGVFEVVKTLDSLGSRRPDYYAVAILEEAVELRKQGVVQPILVFNPVMEHDADLFSRFDLIASVFNTKHLAILKKSNAVPEKPIKVHVKVDTGMHRLGMDYRDALPFIKKLSQNPHFLIDGVYTHFANADEKESDYPKLQLKRFNEVLGNLKTENIPFGLAHAANSSAILNFPEAYFDMVRPGILIFGYSPFSPKPKGISLRPVMSLISYIDSIKEIDKGESISYGRTFFTKNKTRVATVPIGYADGYNRNLSNKAKAIINGKFYNQVGNVTMDRIMFDIDAGNCRIGDKVILLGNDKDRKIEFNVWDWSRILNTIPYEVMCNISKRIPRIYKN
jgi:alanine racemase